MTVSNNSASPAYQGPGSATRPGPSDEACQSKAAKSEQRLTMSVMGLLGIRMLMDHKFHEHVIVLAIGVAAVAVLARERQTKMLKLTGANLQLTQARNWSRRCPVITFLG